MKIKKKWILRFYEHPSLTQSTRVLTNANAQFTYRNKTNKQSCTFFDRLQQRPFYSGSYVPREYEVGLILPSEFFI